MKLHCRFSVAFQFAFFVFPSLVNRITFCNGDQFHIALTRQPSNYDGTTVVIGDVRHNSVVPQ